MGGSGPGERKKLRNKEARGRGTNGEECPSGRREKCFLEISHCHISIQKEKDVRKAEVRRTGL